MALKSKTGESYLLTCKEREYFCWIAGMALKEIRQCPCTDLLHKSQHQRTGTAIH